MAPVASSRALSALFLFLFRSLYTFTYAQSISTNTPVPPLQWLNVTGILQGSAPPPLMDASLGYDETSRTLLIFGGESQGGFVQSSTYLLNLDTLTWSTPSPPSNLLTAPSARSAVVGGEDFAASNRHGHVIIGGKGLDGGGLSDVWEYDYNNQFWREVAISLGSPSPRWGASGGIDIRTAPIQDPLVPGPNNTFYLAGGQSDASHANSLSDIWRLTISGTLSSNLPDSVQGSWANQPIGNLPAKFGQAGTVIGRQIIVAGGCTRPLTSASPCMEQDSYVINTEINTDIAPVPCPAPRDSPVLVPNLNGFSSSFSSQVFLLLGTVNATIWQDDGGLNNGEVAVLDINTGSWSRVLPSGDPDGSGRPTFPSPRSGASAFSSPVGLVGQSRPNVSDTIVFGGRDASGVYLSEVWLLRTYQGSVTQSSPQWPGFGDGQLQTGINANGTGVSVGFMTKCASISTPLPTSGSSPNKSPGSSTSLHPFDTSLAHKILSPLSTALLLLATVLYRISPHLESQDGARITVFASAAIALIAYAAGLGGLASSFSGIITTSALGKHSPSGVNLKTAHGQVGLALSVALYVSLPILLFFVWSSQRRRASAQGHDEALPMDKSQSHHGPRASTPSRHQSSTPKSLSPLALLQSWSLWPRRSYETPVSNDTESIDSAEPQRGFVVVNRPARSRHMSERSAAAMSLNSSNHNRALPNLRDMDWLERRRHLNTVDALDYAINQADRVLAAAAVRDVAAASHVESQPELPGPYRLASGVVYHTLLLASGVLALVELWFRAPKAGFAVFLIWTLAFYLMIFAFSWNGWPKKSLLSFLLVRFRPHPPPPNSPISAVDPAASDRIPFPASRGPYIHRQSPHRAMHPPAHDDASISPLSVETHEDDDDDNEEIRQTRIEEEMARRDVSIVTVPRRKLWITNPS